MRLTGETCRIDEVSDLDREQMFALMQRYYENVRREDFELDLAGKDWVITARCPRTSRVLGFSTQSFVVLENGDDDLGVLFSGDTIVDSRYWARNPVSTLWGRLALSLIDQNPERALYWFLISKGYKTYRFLPVFFREFYPRANVSTPMWATQMIETMAAQRFGRRYCRERGIVRSDLNSCRLRTEVATVTESRLKDESVSFFQAANPGHAEGDELCCLAPLTRENFKRSAFRVIGTCVDMPTRSKSSSS